MTFYKFKFVYQLTKILQKKRVWKKCLWLQFKAIDPLNNKIHIFNQIIVYTCTYLQYLPLDISWFSANPFRFLCIYFEISIRIRFVCTFFFVKWKYSTQYTPETLHKPKRVVTTTYYVSFLKNSKNPQQPLT